MVDEVAQVPAAQGVEAAQAVVQDDAQANQQLQVLFFPWFVLALLANRSRFISPVRKFDCLVVCTLASCYLAASSNCFYGLRFFIFRFASFVTAFCLLRAFLSVSACCCASFSPLVTFHVLLHGFVPPLMFYECYL